MQVDHISFEFAGNSVSNTTPTRGVAGRVRASPESGHREAEETFLLKAMDMSFLERLSLAWKIVFPSSQQRRFGSGGDSNSAAARIAKQRLKMILFSDRCAVSDEAKRMIVANIVRSLSDFVEIESRDKVQLSVSADSGLGTVYSVTVPVRRVKPEYQDLDEPGSITNIEYEEKGDDDSSSSSSSSPVDVRFDFYLPD